MNEVIVILNNEGYTWRDLQARVTEKRYPQVGLKEHQMPLKKQQQGRVFDVTETGGARKFKQNDVSIPRRPPKSNATKPPKPVDEDLYKIPPELLHSSKRVHSFSG